jgi:phosphohistidine phosphatase
MKTLLLLRHAKSSPIDLAGQDFERPLNDRGKKEAVLIADFIRRQNIPMDLIVCSPALRAKQTMELLFATNQPSPEVRLDRRIYNASPTQLLEVISGVEDKRQSLLIIGHNPGMEELLTLLLGKEQHMPTAALAQVALSTKNWNQLIAGKGILETFVTAKGLEHDEIGQQSFRDA